MSKIRENLSNEFLLDQLTNTLNEIEESDALEEVSKVIDGEILEPSGNYKEEKELDEDFAEARNHLKELIAIGKEALEKIKEVSDESESNKDFEAVSSLIRSLNGANKSLMNLHKTRKEVKNMGEQTKTPSKVENKNTFFVGSTKDLQNMIKDMRSNA